MPGRSFEHRKNDPPLCPEQVDDLSLRSQQDMLNSRQEFLAMALCQRACAVGENGPHCQKLATQMVSHCMASNFFEKRRS